MNVKRKYASTYRSWYAMKTRCRWKKHQYYRLYGGRGITVCERWNNFKNFLADMGERPEGMTLDRIDRDSGYYKENCRWATRQQQTDNSITPIWLEYQGQRLSLNQWSKKLNITQGTIWVRYHKGWPIEKILSPFKFHRNGGREGMSNRRVAAFHK